MEEDAKGGFLDTKWVRPLFVCIHPQWSHYPVVLDVMGRVPWSKNSSTDIRFNVAGVLKGCITIL